MRPASLTVALAAGLLALALPASAQTGPAPPPAAAAPHADDPNTVECRSMPIYGTRMRSQQCMTKRDWDQARADGRGFVERIQRDSSFGSNFGR